MMIIILTSPMDRRRSITSTIRAAVLLVLLASCATADARGGPGATPADHPLLPMSLEIEWALSAAPAHLRDGARVMTMTPTGFQQARPGSNPFTCLVNRRGGDVFPVCWDAEGTRTLMAADVEATRLRLSGASRAEVERSIAASYASRHRTAPARPGVAYMLSPLRVQIDTHGAATRTPALPHAMFYAPDLTNADIGGARGSVAFMNKVGPDGMIIVPVGASERQAISEQSRGLVSAIERALGLSPQL